jgi:hypothetical protein
LVEQFADAGRGLFDGAGVFRKRCLAALVEQFG